MPGPDNDALVIYLRAGDIFNKSNPYMSASYVQAPCSYLRMVIRDSGLFKVPTQQTLPRFTLFTPQRCSQIDVVTDPTAHDQLRHPCLAELQALQHPYRVTVHGASIREDFGFLTKAHNLVLSGVSSFADTAVLLSRWVNLHHLCCCVELLSSTTAQCHGSPSAKVTAHAVRQQLVLWRRVMAR